MQDYQSLHQGQAANFVKRVSLERLNVKFCFSLTGSSVPCAAIPLMPTGGSSSETLMLKLFRLIPKLSFTSADPSS